MAKFIRGDIDVIPFPFSNLTNFKRRPALVIANLTGNDLIICQITSKKITDSYGIILSDNDFISGSLNQISNIRPNKIFTADSNIILYKIGQINEIKLLGVINQIVEIISIEKTF